MMATVLPKRSDLMSGYNITQRAKLFDAITLVSGWPVYGHLCNLQRGGNSTLSLVSKSIAIAEYIFCYFVITFYITLV